MILGILGTIAVAQLLESYILTPLIVGDEVDINPLTTIVAVIGFTVMWGPVGAIVAIPIVAILRVICQHVEGLEDYAYLLGQD
jgi:predicted PurR-regulated permease PerM